MKIATAHIKDFKRFTDLHISGIPESARLVLLVGPNGTFAIALRIIVDGSFAPFLTPSPKRQASRNYGSDESREVNVDLLETFNYLIGLTVQHIAVPQTFSALFRRDDDPDLPDGAPRRLLLDGRIKQEDVGRWWFRTVTGTIPDGRKTLVIWRKRPGGETPEGMCPTGRPA